MGFGDIIDHHDMLRGEALSFKNKFITKADFPNKG
jgi:hypothetical protein